MAQSEPAVTRVLEWFEIDGDALLGEEPLKGIPLSDLQSLFGVPAENPMYDGWEVRAEHVSVLQACVDHEIDLSAHAYFVACHASPGKSAS